MAHCNGGALATLVLAIVLFLAGGIWYLIPTSVTYLLKEDTNEATVTLEILEVVGIFSPDKTVDDCDAIKANMKVSNELGLFLKLENTTECAVFDGRVVAGAFRAPQSGNYKFESED